MKIVMIGISGAGKTAFLAAMYSKLNRKGIGGFSIAPYGESLQERLAVADELNEISFGNNNGYNFSAATATEPKLWPFELLYRNKQVTTFEWLDYRGGVLTERADEQFQEVLSHIEICDALILVADSSIITDESIDVDEKRNRIGIHFMENLLKDFSAFSTSRKDMIITIALTQCDAVPEKWKLNNWYLLVEHGIELFDFIIELCRDNPLWNGGIIPVSAVGEGTTERIVRGDGVTVDKIVNRPAPYNVEHVVFYSIGCILQRAEKVAEGEYRRSHESMMRAMQNSGTWHRLMAWLRSETDPKRIVESRLREVERDHKELTRLREAIIPLHTIATQKVRILK